MGVTECPRSLNPCKAIAMTICPIIVHFSTWRARSMDDVACEFARATVGSKGCYTSDGYDGSGVESGVGIGRKFWSSVNRHDGSGIGSLAFICKHSRWRTREMTRDFCFCYCFLFSKDKEDVCNGTRHNTTVINTQTEKPEKTAAIQQHGPD